MPENGLFLGASPCIHPTATVIDSQVGEWTGIDQSFNDTRATRGADFKTGMNPVLDAAAGLAVGGSDRCDQRFGFFWRPRSHFVVRETEGMAEGADTAGRQALIERLEGVAATLQPQAGLSARRSAGGNRRVIPFRTFFGLPNARVFVPVLTFCGSI